MKNKTMFGSLIQFLRSLFNSDNDNMKLVEIKGLFQMNTGAPMPVILDGVDGLFLTFYSNDEEAPVITIHFHHAIYHCNGTPNDEALGGHRYFKLGLGFYGFYEVIASDLIEELKQINKVHPRYNPTHWLSYRHFILTFHDETFECVAKEYEVIRHNAGKSVFEITKSIFEEQTSRY